MSFYQQFIVSLRSKLAIISNVWQLKQDTLQMVGNYKRVKRLWKIEKLKNDKLSHLLQTGLEKCSGLFERNIGLFSYVLVYFQLTCQLKVG